MKITEYAKVTDLSDDRVLLSDGTNGTKTIPVSELLYAMVDSGLLSGEMRRNIYRGKNLGSSVSLEQWEVIRNGKFTNLFVGDYWVIGDKTYRIADIDYLLHCGDTELTTHHLIIVPDTNMGNQKMNDTNITTGAYVGSKMRTEYMATAKTEIKTDFGESHIIKYRDWLTNATSNGKASAGGWNECDIELMNERMVYGGPCFAPTSDGSVVPAHYTVCKSQLALFMLNPKAITTRYAYWLRDVVSAAYFAYVDDVGHSNSYFASASGGVRPFFAIG